MLLKTAFLPQHFEPPGFNSKYLGSWPWHSYLLINRQLIRDASLEGQGWDPQRREPSQVFFALMGAGNGAARGFSGVSRAACEPRWCSRGAGTGAPHAALGRTVGKKSRGGNQSHAGKHRSAQDLGKKRRRSALARRSLRPRPLQARCGLRLEGSAEGSPQLRTHAKESGGFASPQIPHAPQRKE